MLLQTHLVTVSWIQNPRETEVGDFEGEIITVDKEVAWLEVSVQHVCGVQVLQPSQQLK